MIAKCIKCGTETKLYDRGVAICTSCFDALEAKRELPVTVICFASDQNEQRLAEPHGPLSAAIPVAELSSQVLEKPLRRIQASFASVMQAGATAGTVSA
jgi:hypothetical protein